MKSVKVVNITCFISSIILFFFGVFFVLNAKTAPPPQKSIDSITSIEPSENTNPSDKINNYITGGTPMNFLILVKEASGMNTDTIIVAHYDPNTKQVSLLTVPRDTKPSSTVNYKINSSYYIGLNKYQNKSGLTQSEQKQKAVEYATQMVSNLTGITLDYYIYLEIDTIKQIIDKLGGVYFDVPADLKYTDPTQDLYIDLKKGYQLLDGDKAEQLLRFRKPHNLSKASTDLRKFYDGSDLKRTEMQIRFVNELIKQKVNILDLPKFIPIISYAFDNIVTNIPLSDILNLFGGFTQDSRPEMNTFKLYGVDKRLNNIDYFVYIEKIENTKTRDTYDSDEVIEKYFQAKSDLFTPDSDQNYNYKAILNENPSNDEANIKSNGKDNP